MFDDDEKKAEAVPISENEPTGVEPTPTAPAPSNSPGEIHTMPKKFHDGLEKKGGPKNKFLMVGIIIIVILVLGVATAFLFSKIMKPENQNLNANLVTNQNISNLNQNLNQNANFNANLNLNQNLNENLNLNANQNVNIFFNLNANRNANVNANRNISLNVNGPLPSSTDSDRDGLTDKEEEDLGTNTEKPDSDIDSYSDGVEIANGYNPLGDGRITSSTAIKVYTNEDYHYTILYPHSWLAQAVGQDNKEVLFTADTAEFVEVLVADNSSSATAEEWYLSQFPELVSEDLTTVTTWNNEKGVLSLDGNTIYLASDSYIYIITYNTGTRKEANFRKTFEMMYQSFTLLSEEETNLNTNINANQNRNTNQNTNANRNSNLNTNSNRNENSNQNTNENSNVNS